jgi:hypothetical protein
MQKWEYKIVEGAYWPDDEGLINKLGGEGWELVTVTFNDSGSPKLYYFKRPR